MNRLLHAKHIATGQFRHRDQRLGWTLVEFHDWANGIAEPLGYRVRFLPVGPEDEAVGAPTQTGVFARSNS